MKIASLVAGLALICGAMAWAQDEHASAGARQPEATGPAAMAATASGGILFTIFSNVAGHPSSQVPGLPGVCFEPGTLGIHFQRPFCSPSGNWILAAFNDSALATDDEMILVSGQVAVREGTVAPWDPGSTVGSFHTRMGINDAGEYAFAVNALPAGPADDLVLKGMPGGAVTVVAREGDPVPGLPGVTYDDGLTGPHITASGAVGFEADGLDGAITTATDNIYELGGVVLAQQGVTVPNFQAGGLQRLLQAIDYEDQWTDAAGQNWLLQGDTDNPNPLVDDVVVVNGDVVLQEGYVVPMSGFPYPIDDNGIVAVAMDFGGRWFARGNNDVSERDWVVRSGVVVAAVGEPITPGSTEFWDDATLGDCFFAQVGNGHGDWVVGGLANNPNPGTDAVLVLNGSRVICREGDPVDLDNNGLYDDDTYIETFGTDDLALDDACNLWFVATLRDGFGVPKGQGFFRLAIDHCPCGYISEYAPGCPGGSGTPPVQVMNGSPMAGGMVSLGVRNGAPWSPALLLLGLSTKTVVMDGGCFLWLTPLPWAITLPLDGTGSLQFNTVIPAAAAGHTIYSQWVVADGGVTHGFANSGALKLVVE